MSDAMADPSPAAIAVCRVDELALSYRPWVWPFAHERQSEIAAHFANARAARPQLWNGRVMLARNPRHEGMRFSAEYFDTDFASFLAWRDWGCPDREVFNGFGMGALRGSDGVFLLGEMAAHTANAGKIYFPSGTPDPGDRLGDRLGDVVDIAGSVFREVQEETGLAPEAYRASPTWYCIRVGQAIALMRLLELDAPAEQLQIQIARFLATEAEPELSRMHLVRDRQDFTPAMPAFVTALIETVLAEEASR
jgi:8-oxo-dGTP pyrophosphatase MutT (NUDIX family)